ncbi:CoA transferase [Yinghuangia aomiensis]|uniref:CoA transferase n=1 Tax=Yinghuangia aomiensis TaxID=676205 RepID=A0ABP9I9A2_9ACTN
MADYRVIEVTRGLAGAYAGKLLVDAGATVARATLPDHGDPVFRSTGIGVHTDEEDSALFRYLHAGKQRLRPATGNVPIPAAWTRGADIVIEDLGPSEVCTAQLRESHPKLVVVSISPFGHTGPWAKRPANEFILQALSGSTGGRGVPEGIPMQCGAQLGAWAAGGYAAVAAMSVARRVRRGGAGDHVDVSMLEAMLLTQNPFGYVAAQLTIEPEESPARLVETPSVEPTKNGFVGFCTVTAQQFQDFLVMIERPDLLDDAELASASGRRRRRKEFSTAVHTWTTAHTTEEILELADALRIPAVPLTTADRLVNLPHFRERGVFVPNPHGFLQPRVPYKLGDTPSPPVRRTPAPEEAGSTPAWPERNDASVRSARSGPDRGLPLQGLRVVDLTAFWAGPSATHLLALLGAEVVKVESTRRPDPMRFTTARRDVARWWEYGPVFYGANAGKQGITLDLTHDQGRRLLSELVKRSDIVIENFTPRVLDHLGIGADRLRTWNPHAVIVRMPAFGLDGPWRDRPGFAQTMEQVGGLASVTGDPDLPPMLPRASDPIAGIHAVIATLCALEQRDRTDDGCLVEVPMIETVLNVGAQAIVEYSAYGIAAERRANRSPHAAPQGVYACQGDENWIALSVENDDQWRALHALIGGPELPSAEDRHRGHDDLDARLGGWFARQALAAAVECLLAAGIPAAAVHSPATAASHPHLAARGFLEHIEHPLAGHLDLPGAPFRFAARRTAPWLSGPPPTLGQDNNAVLGGLLGLSPQELEELRALGIVGNDLS